MHEPDWQSRLSPIEEIFFATSPSAILSFNEYGMCGRSIKAHE
jgi:hypothetical protein